MKSLFLAVALLTLGFTAGSEESKKVGYNIGICDTGFVALHVQVSDKEIDVDEISPGPNRVEKIDPPRVFEFTTKDGDGLHYVNKDAQIEFVLKFNDGQVDGLLVDLEKTQPNSHVFGSQGAENGLQQDAFTLHDRCVRERSN